MEWKEFFDAHASTMGITLVFSFIGSGALLWARANIQPVTALRALTVIAAGQLVAAIVTPIFFGFLLWSKFIAPLVGALSGLVGIFLLRTGIKVGERIEGRGDDIADAGINILKRKSGTP